MPSSEERRTDRTPGEPTASQAGRAPRPLRDEEPFATMRAHPRRFGVGVPAVFVVAIGAGVLLAERSLSLGLAALLVIQTAGLLGLYVPALRRTLREDAPLRGGAEEEGVLRREGRDPSA